jgi:hypothetical protein
MVSTDTLYPADKKDLSPRAGFTFAPSESRKTVIRGSWGLFYDMFAVNFFTANTAFANGGALGVGNNPGGTSPVFSITQTKFSIADGAPVFGTTPNPPYGAFAVSQDLKLPVRHQLQRQRAAADRADDRSRRSATWERAAIVSG